MTTPIGRGEGARTTVAISPARWRQIEQILDRALDLPLHERVTYLDRACGADAALRAALERLLRACEEAGSFLGEPALAYAAPLIVRAFDAGASADIDTPLPETLVVPTAPSAGDRVGPYRIVREAGRGGMGAVYLAERADGQFEQRVALKLIKRGMDSDEVLRRFLAERQILARLAHPHVARLLDGGIHEDGRPWFAMEYVDGEPITTYCDARRLTIRARLALFRDVCDAVRYAQQNLVVHRDLKPSNILVSDAGATNAGYGTVKLLDFGIAKLLGDGDGALTGLGGRAMTPEHAAPEQVRGEPATTATDVYSLGVVLYELLTGHPAQRVDRVTPAEVERVVCTVSPDAPSAVVTRAIERAHPDGRRETIPPEASSDARGANPDRLRQALRGDLDTIVLKALHKDPARRYPSAESLLEDLRRHEAGLPVQARPDSVAYRLRKFVRRHRIGVAAGAALVLALFGGLAGTRWQAREASREAAKARAVASFVVDLFRANDPAESRGREVTARELLRRGSQRVDSVLADQPELQVELLDVLGDIHLALGLYPQADTLLRRALTLARARYGDGHPQVASSMATWASVLVAQGRYDVADSVLESALSIRRRALGDNHPDVDQTLNDLGVVQKERGNYERARTLHLDVLARSIKRYGRDHLEVATDLSNLGGLLEMTGDLQGADSVVREALAIRRRHLDSDHPSVLLLLLRLGSLRMTQGNYAEAERLEREVLEKRRRLYPDGHPDVALALNELAVTLVRQGRYDEAEPLYVEGLAIGQAWRGQDHPETITSVNNLATLRYRKGDLRGAETTMREVLTAWRRSRGEAHPNTLAALGNLGSILSELRDYGQAEPMLRRALALRRTHLGSSHEDVGSSLRALGVLLHRKGDLVEAERVLREAVAVFREVLPDGHTFTAGALSDLGAVLTDRGRAEEAEPLLREALTIRSRNIAPSDTRVALTQRALGLCLVALGRDREGETLLLESHRTLSANPGQTRERDETGRRLVAFYEARGRRADASKYRRILTQ